MSGTTEPEVHVDTPAQSYARQIIETDQRVTHVRRPDEEPPPIEEPPPEDAFSLTVLVHKQPQQKAKTVAHIEKDKEKGKS